VNDYLMKRKQEGAHDTKLVSFCGYPGFCMNDTHVVRVGDVPAEAPSAVRGFRSAAGLTLFFIDLFRRSAVPPPMRCGLAQWQYALSQ
jgi:hypothetical protein